jgi:hypothetical protein
MHLLRREADRLRNEGRTDLTLRLHAVATVRFGPAMHDLRVRSEPDGQGTSVYLDRPDVAMLARHYSTRLTEAEIDVVASNPVRAPALLRFAQAAETAAATRLRSDPSFPEDAYRHVYWSYLLTREYGPEFAERVTEAHEEGATYEFGEAARRMDVNNNARGRVYASAGVPESELADRVRTDPKVIRSPEAALP